MKKILLDTSFILTCVKQKIDFFEELFNLDYEIIIPREVLGEIEKLSTSKKKAQPVAHLTKSLLDLNKEHFKKIELGKGVVDNLIVKYAKEHPKVAVATLDAEIKNKLKKENVIAVIRKKRRIEVQ